jgi:hypothetical protein
MSNGGQPLVSATPSPNVSSNPVSPALSRLTPVETLRETCTTLGGPLTSSPVSLRCFPPPPSPADSAQDGQGETHTILHGTITALKIVQQIIGLAPVPGLKSLVGVVLNISETVNVNFDATLMRKY